jgi:hypothetical protein
MSVTGTRKIIDQSIDYDGLTQANLARVFSERDALGRMRAIAEAASGRLRPLFGLGAFFPSAARISRVPFLKVSLLIARGELTRLRRGLLSAVSGHRAPRFGCSLRAVGRLASW